MVKRALLTQSWAEKERQRENGPGAKYLKGTAIKASKGHCGGTGHKSKRASKGVSVHIWIEAYMEKDERFSPLRERDRVRVRGTYRIQLRRPAGRRPQIWGKEVETADPNHNRDPCYSIAPSQQRITLTGGQE
ncbi:hypothetical protein TEQG_00444 [Trichophyton equinum CBS 127.97]|uniref:Uncharacterized protein n=1 Tax=Trichophyton equinum (strain ATCC MYA-4606 / CBS 127.97) TaxID=559882 RepID=F2PHM3_TRIEC|nr:hypothetical protein TEQG_00444 [Trichophyton equinum CBS 127.97]